MIKLSDSNFVVNAIAIYHIIKDKMLKKFYSNYGGILIGGLYGLMMRLLFGISFKDFSDLFSITFIWVVPVIIGTIPLIFSSKENLESIGYRIFKPIFSVLIFFIFCYITRVEDVICLIIIAFPFLLISGIAGAILGSYILKYRKKNGILYSIFLLPLLSGLMEPNFPTPKENFETTSSIIINAEKSKIWRNIVRVRKIQEKEYNKGFFNYSGIPRPLFAELNKDTLGGKRIGHFEGGLKFEENIIEWDRNNSVTFDIKIIPSNTNKTVFERHMLNGQHFKFLNATYELKEITKGRIELLLTTKYQLDTKINFYGEFWGEQLLSDFQYRLINVIKNRCEKTVEK